MQYPEYNICDELLLDTQNMLWEKLNTRKAGQFKISGVGRSACKLKGLSKRYLPIFHVSLSESYLLRPEAPPSIKIPLLSECQEYYTSEKIIEHGLNNNNKDCFLVVWK